MAGAFFMKLWYAVRNQLAGGTELWTISGFYWIMKRSRELSPGRSGQWSGFLNITISMDELATVKEREPDGNVKCYVDEVLKQAIALKLLEEAERRAKEKINSV